MSEVIYKNIGVVARHKPTGKFKGSGTRTLLLDKPYVFAGAGPAKNSLHHSRGYYRNNGHALRKLREEDYEFVPVSLVVA